MSERCNECGWEGELEDMVLKTYPMFGYGDDYFCPECGSDKVEELY